eukprot:TRINITY_DN95564_c0_g1_i1.p1 TRINITY_DN95564_c0_g1~~TRINITY_DN95564_c0_g1_i1.p1  ORF type:complete len:474 (-),score=6.07 TRINITY_DN95564_c0_g1_i1:33-1454(-)
MSLQESTRTDAGQTTTYGVILLCFACVVVLVFHDTTKPCDCGPTRPNPPQMSIAHNWVEKFPVLDPESPAKPQHKKVANRHLRPNATRSPQLSGTQTKKPPSLQLTPSTRNNTSSVDFWLFVPVSCTAPEALVRAWVHHYTEILRVSADRIWVTLYGEVSKGKPGEANPYASHIPDTFGSDHGVPTNCDSGYELWTSLGLGKITVAPHVFHRCARTMDLYQQLYSVQRHHNTWWTQRDIDEFSLLPTRFNSLLEWIQYAHEHGFRAIRTQNSDRVTQSGFLKPLEWEYPNSANLTEQYPLCCEGLSHLMKCRGPSLVLKTVAMHHTLLPDGTGTHNILKTVGGSPTLSRCPHPDEYYDLAGRLKRWGWSPPPEELPMLNTKYPMIAHFKYTGWLVVLHEEHLRHNGRMGYGCAASNPDTFFKNNQTQLQPDVLDCAHCWPCGSRQHWSRWNVWRQKVKQKFVNCSKFNSLSYH